MNNLPPGCASADGGIDHALESSIDALIDNIDSAETAIYLTGIAKEPRKPKYPIGTKFIRRGSNPREETISNILMTYDNKGSLISLRYVTERDFLGQIVTDYDTLETTIARSEILFIPEIL